MKRCRFRPSSSLLDESLEPASRGIALIRDDVTVLELETCRLGDVVPAPVDNEDPLGVSGRARFLRWEGSCTSLFFAGSRR